MAKYTVTLQRTVTQTIKATDVEATNSDDAIEVAKFRVSNWEEDCETNESNGDLQVVECRETQSNREQAKEMREYAEMHRDAFPEEAAALEAEADRLDKL